MVRKEGTSLSQINSSPYGYGLTERGFTAASLAL